MVQQVEAIKTEMTAQTEAVLKAREEELGKKAEETFKNITGTLGKDLEEMKKSFNENKKGADRVFRIAERTSGKCREEPEGTHRRYWK